MIVLESIFGRRLQKLRWYSTPQHDVLTLEINNKNMPFIIFFYMLIYIFLHRSVKANARNLWVVGSNLNPL